MATGRIIGTPINESDPENLLSELPPSLMSPSTPVGDRYSSLTPPDSSQQPVRAVGDSPSTDGSQSVTFSSEKPDDQEATFGRLGSAARLIGAEDDSVGHFESGSDSQPVRDEHSHDDLPESALRQVKTVSPIVLSDSASRPIANSPVRLQGSAAEPVGEIDVTLQGSAAQPVRARVSPEVKLFGSALNPVRGRDAKEKQEPPAKRALYVSDIAVTPNPKKEAKDVVLPNSTQRWLADPATPAPGRKVVVAQQGSPLSPEGQPAAADKEVLKGIVPQAAVSAAPFHPLAEKTAVQIENENEETLTSLLLDNGIYTKAQALIHNLTALANSRTGKLKEIGLEISNLAQAELDKVIMSINVSTSDDEEIIIQMTESLKLTYQFINRPNPERKAALEQNAKNCAIGKSNFMKKLAGFLLMILGAVGVGFGIATTPVTPVNYGFATAGGVTFFAGLALFNHNRQKGLSKSMSNLAEQKAEDNELRISPQPVLKAF